jgi:hypothetical protein
VGPLLAVGGVPLAVPIPIVLINTPTQVQTLSIDAPSAGSVLISGTIAYTPTIGTTVGIVLRNDTTSNSATGPQRPNVLIAGSDTLTYTFALPVNAGQNVLVLQVTSTLIGTIVTQADLTALFVAYP